MSSEPYREYSEDVRKDYLRNLEQSNEAIPKALEILGSTFGTEKNDITVYEAQGDGERDDYKLKKDMEGIDLYMPSIDASIALKTKSPEMLDGQPYWDIPLRVDGRYGGDSEWKRFESEVKDESFDGELPDFILVVFANGEVLRGWVLVSVEAIIEGLRNDDVKTLVKTKKGSRFKLIELPSVATLATKMSPVARFTQVHMAKRFAREIGSEDSWECYHSNRKL